METCDPRDGIGFEPGHNLSQIRRGLSYNGQLVNTNIKGPGFTILDIQEYFQSVPSISLCKSSGHASKKRHFAVKGELSSLHFTGRNFTSIVFQKSNGGLN